jgi:hypothetical protein
MFGLEKGAGQATDTNVSSICCSPDGDHIWIIGICGASFNLLRIYVCLTPF